MGQTFTFLLYIFDELFALRTATLVEAGIDGVLVGVHQFAHGHAQEERLAVALGDAETTQQLGGYFARLVIGVQQVTSGSGVDAVIVGEDALPIGTLAISDGKTVGHTVTLVVPSVAAPSLIPHPVAVELEEALAVREFVGGVRPVPIGGLGIEVETLGVVYAVHGLDGLLDEGGRRPAPRFEVGEDVDVVDMHGGGSGQLAMRLTPRATGLVGRQRLAGVLRHGVDVGIEGEGLLQY